jgi:hypothetical protein
LTDGAALTSPPRGARGHPDQPLSAEALRAKFIGCAATALRGDDAEAIADQLEHLEAIPDIRALTARLGGEQE